MSTSTVLDPSGTLLPYSIQQYSSQHLEEADFLACFNLVRMTSASSYRKSTKGWSARDKKAEMRDKDMNYLIVRESKGQTANEKQGPSDDKQLGVSTLTSSEPGRVLGFLSYMLTEDDDVPVIYCYEIHLLDSLRGHGVGTALMKRMEETGQAAGMEMAMLTVFTSNATAISFYKKKEYSKWDEEPVENTRKRTRSSAAIDGTRTQRVAPSYIIMAKRLPKARQKMRAG